VIRKMGGKKKVGENSKVAAANERKAKNQAEKDRQAQQQREAQDAAEWSLGANSKGAARKKAQEDKQLEAMAKKAELKKLQEDDEANMGKSVAKKKKVKKKDLPPWEEALQDASKKSKAEKAERLRRKKEEKEQRQREEAAAAEAERRRAAERRGEDPDAEGALESYMAYEGVEDTLMPNRNAGSELEHDAVSGLDAILGDLTLGAAGEEKHPERRRKALFKAYYERTLPDMREEFPNLKLSQYKQRIFERWQKSPENPMNIARAQEQQQQSNDEEEKKEV